VWLMYILLIFKDFVSKLCYTPDIVFSQFCGALNPDSSTHMTHCYSPWLLAVFGLCFAKDTFFLNLCFVSNHEIIVSASIFLVLIATISQLLHVFSNFVPVSHGRNVEDHIVLTFSYQLS
jgi:hypothetical protein